MGNASCGVGDAFCGDKVTFINCCDDYVVSTSDDPASCLNVSPAANQQLFMDDVPGWEVELLVSPIGDLRGVAGYHTSVLVAGSEYFYGQGGIIHSHAISSHKKKSKMQRICMGMSTHNGADLTAALEDYFPPGHYDLLRKNCNAFSDCALYFLCGQRLSWSFRSVDQIGMLADHFGLIQSISAGEYNPNPHAWGFDLEAIILKMNTERAARKLLELSRAANRNVAEDPPSPRAAPDDWSQLKNLSRDAAKVKDVKLLGVQNLGGVGQAMTTRAL